MDSKDCKKLIKWIKSSRYLATFTTDCKFKGNSIHYYTTCGKASPQGGWFFLNVDGDKITVFSKNNDLGKFPNYAFGDVNKQFKSLTLNGAKKHILELAKYGQKAFLKYQKDKLIKKLCEL